MNAPTDSTEDAVSRRRLVWLTVLVAVFVLVLVLLLYRITKPVPHERWLGAFDGSHASISVAVTDEPPFQVLLALPKRMPSDWSGSVSMTAPDGSQWSTPCSATTMKPCNWLHDHPHLDCYILTWDSTPHLSEFMRSDLTYSITLTGTSRFSSPAVVLLSGMKSGR